MTGRGSLHAPPVPSSSLTSFPAVDVTGTWFRAHADRATTDHGCWWFSSLTPGVTPETHGRFDLPSPRGTCYVGSTPEVAVRERLGPFLSADGKDGQAVFEDLLATPDGPLAVSSLQITAAHVADLTDAAASAWGVNRSLSTGTGVYATTQDWADAFDQAGFGGIHYDPRFTLTPGDAEPTASPPRTR